MILLSLPHASPELQACAIRLDWKNSSSLFQRVSAQHDRGALFQQWKHVTETLFRQASGMKEPDKHPCPSSSDPLLPWRLCLWNFPQHLWVASPDGKQGFATWACWKTLQAKSIIENLLHHVFPIMLSCFTRHPKPGSTHQRQKTS